MKELIVGFDIGSISINTILCDINGNIIKEFPYYRHFGKTIKLCSKILEQIEKEFSLYDIKTVVFTGTHGINIGKALGAHTEVETIAQATAIEKLYPNCKTLISIGGHDSSLLILNNDIQNSHFIADFKLNEACAAGTGSFIDQQAERIFSDECEFSAIKDPQQRLESILNRFIEEGIKSNSPANVACRCTVFTKSDMIHLQNKGIENSHIIAGLHEGVARNFKSTLINNRKLEDPIYFIGGYAANKLAIKSFEKILNKKIIVPEYFTSLGAYGAILNSIEQKNNKKINSIDILALKNSQTFKAVKTEPLQLKKSIFTECGEATGIKNNKQAYIGIDIGSTTTKLVLLSPSNEILFKTYIPTEGQPITALKKAFIECINAMGDSRPEILGVGTTGSGREVAGLFTGADDIVNEVTAHALGTLTFDPEIDTIFELGGQDAKYTKISNGQISDFKMNKVCAAGTGSFLEETANKLGINIKGEYESLALSSKSPYKLTERCTVYMESDLMSYLQNGASINDLLAGLSQAVVHNYLNRVVQEGKIGNRISFQGGPSLNKSIVAAFEMITGKPIITFKHREVMGAIGAAIHTKKEIETKYNNYKSKFKGWNIVDIDFSHKEEICKRNPNCHNSCKLQVYRIGDTEAIYGGECGMYETSRSSTKPVANYAKIRNSIFLKYLPKNTEKDTTYKIKIGIPRSLSFHQLGIIWTNFFKNLGFETVISPETTNEVANAGISAMTCETCFPVKISHGHANWLKDKCDLIFLPMMIEMNKGNNTKLSSYYCPYVEANPYMLKSALQLEDKKILKPAVYLSNGIESLCNAFYSEFLRLGIKISKEKISESLKKAIDTNSLFENELKKVGKTVLDKLKDDKAIIIIGRPYSIYDSRTNLNLFNTFSKLGIHAIPQDFLTLDDKLASVEYPNMYWGFGNKILSASYYINKHKNLYGLYLTSFGCGPDSFTLHFFANEMQKTNRPYLELELDEHSAGAGVETRLLAFIDTIKSNNSEVYENSYSTIKTVKKSNELKKRTLYIPYMTAGAECLAASFRTIGIKTELMPTYTQKGLEYGKHNTSGKECYPCIVTTGDMLALIDKKLQEGVDVENEIAILMPETEGPCRFGQYNKLQRIILDKYGFKNLPIIAPTSEDSYSCNGEISEDDVKKLRRLVWDAIAYSDLIEKALWKVRPYEKNSGETDKVFEQAMKLGVKAIENGGGFETIKAAKKSAKLFNQIETIKAQKPLIGIVGEIFIRTHKDSNQQLVRELENLGCEVTVASVSEWISYTTDTSLNYAKTALKNNISLSNIKNAVINYSAVKYQNYFYKLLEVPFKELLKNRLDHPTSHILSNVQDTFSNHINGEAILSIGGAFTYANESFDGIINAMPFTCMPSTIASSILKPALRKKIPYIDMVYDGSIQPNRSTNLATFVFQAKQHMKTKDK